MEIKLADKIHIVDQDSGRRANLAFGLAHGGLQAQIYESYTEFMDFAASEGVLFLEDGALGPTRETAQGFFASVQLTIPTVLYGLEPPVWKVVTAMRSGAIDYLAMPFDVDQVLGTLSRLGSELSIHSKLLLRRRRALARVATLSPRERNVLELLIHGNCNKTIASTLGISPRTVEVHRANMLTKLKARASADAVRIGIYAGLEEGSDATALIQHGADF
jgi:FixJ family two-component response regulator